MNEVKSKDYHDYFIKDGRFIGRFEEMYQNVADPWHIDDLGRRLDMDAALLLLQYSGREYSQILDAGCGKGLFTSFLARETGGLVLAGDVSPTAVEQARARNRDPRIEFIVLDLNRLDDLDRPRGRFDLIVLAQTIWCILPNLEKILAGFLDLLQPGGGLLISQNFLQPGQQKYGREIVAGPEDLLALLTRAGFDIKQTLEANRFQNHHLAVLAEKPSRPVAP
ncbi:MAG: class I SAM-dependent methyltransferase [Pseudomonadota bacterium]